MQPWIGLAMAQLSRSAKPPPRPTTPVSVAFDVIGKRMLYASKGRKDAVAVKDPCAEEQHSTEEHDGVDEADWLGVRHEA
jgi:hypothetical protein